jgi:hypothetical protein
MVTAVVNGQQELVSIAISPEVVDPEDVEMLEDLIVAAVTEGHRKAQELITQQNTNQTPPQKKPAKTQ